MNWLNKAIGFFSPKRAYERMMWQEAARSYDAGNGQMSNSHWVTFNQSAQQTDRAHRDVIRAKARDLERNSDIAEGLINAYERNVIGTGIRPQAKVRKEDNQENDELNNQIEELWNEWTRARNCDITAQQSFYEMQSMAIRRLIVDGGMIFIKVYTNSGILPFSLQAKEVDDLDTSINRYGGDRENRVVEGIELDQYGKPVAYYFKQYTVDGFYTGGSERIDGKRVIFLWQKQRPGQIREMSPMARTINRIRDINEYMTAVSVKERVLACLSVFITKSMPDGLTMGRGNRSSGGQTAAPIKNLAPGLIQELQPGDSVNVVNPSGQASNAREFIGIQQRLAGAGQGLSYEATSRDMSQVNYSSARQGLLEDQRTYEKYQDFLVEHFCREVYTEFIISAVLSGKLTFSDFWENKQKYFRHEWIKPGWSWIDPLKEVSANVKAIDCGLDTLARVCGERGLDWREVLEQRAREKEYMTELGLKGDETSEKTESLPANSE